MPALLTLNYLPGRVGYLYTDTYIEPVRNHANREAATAAIRHRITEVIDHLKNVCPGAQIQFLIGKTSISLQQAGTPSVFNVCTWKKSTSRGGIGSCWNTTVFVLS